MSSRKKILFLTHRVPYPPDKGDRIRTFHQLDLLASSHEVYLMCFAERREDMIHAATLRQWCKQVIAIPWNRPQAMWRAVIGGLRGKPLTLAAYADKRMMRQITTWNWKMDFDVATAFSACMAPYAIAARAGRRVLDLCDADSQKWLDYSERFGGLRSIVYRMEGGRLRKYEHVCLSRFDAVMVITERERAVLDPLRGSGRLYVVGNGIAMPARAVRRPSECGPVACFVGAMDYPPNWDAVCWFADSIWPLVLKRQPGATFIIVGRHPPRQVRRLSKQNRIEVTGEVPDVSVYLNEARVVIAPMRIARGMQNKILEAMAMRRPVVMTSSAAGGLDAEPGRTHCMADTPEDFSEKVLHLMADDTLCDEIGEAAQDCVARHYSWKDALQRYHDVVFGDVSSTLTAPMKVPAARRWQSLISSQLVGGRIGPLRIGETRATVR